MAKCKICKGKGTTQEKECVACEGSGVILRTILEEQFDEASELDGTKLHEDEATFIEFEERDYEV